MTEGVGVVLLAVGTFLLCLFLFPVEADACYAANDPLWFARHAETAPWTSLKGHHPLYHVFAGAATVGLDALGVERPGSYGVRVVSGLAAALLVLLVASLAGRGRLLVGTLFAVALVGTRGFVIEGATGENVLPACAAALLCLKLALKERPSLGAVGAAFVLALLLRQDNILILPGLMFALGSARPLAPRWPIRMFAFLLATGLVTLGGYVVAWQVANPDGSFSGYLLDLALRDGELSSWTSMSGFKLVAFELHGAAAGVAVVGRQVMETLPHLLWGAGMLVGLVVAGLLLRGSKPFGRFALTLTLILLVRIPFFAWFEAGNWEWWLLPLCLFAAFGAHLAGGTPRPRPRWVTVAGLLLLGSLATAPIVAHAPTTWDLRRGTLREDAERAVMLSASAPACRFLAYGSIPHTALWLRDIRVDVMHGPPEVALDRLQEYVVKHPGPVVVLLDRFVYDGQPLTRRLEEDAMSGNLDKMPTRPTDHVIRREGRITVIGIGIRP